MSTSSSLHLLYCVCVCVCVGGRARACVRQTGYRRTHLQTDTLTTLHTMKQFASKVKRIWLLLTLCSLCLCCSSIRAQQGFVSIDCGSTKNYTDSNGLEWTSDEVFETITNAGNVGMVTPPASANAPAQFSTIRYFPGDQTKYCYVFNSEDHGVKQGSAYLLRASFWAGSVLPYETRVQNTVNFKLLLNADEWDDVLIILPQTSGAIEKEIYVVAMKETIDVCVAGKGIGMDIAFISSVVLRPLFYNMTSVRLMIDEAGSRPLSYMHRINYGAPSADTIISFLGDGSGDSYDRVWQPDTRSPISTTLPVGTDVNDFPPLKVMQTAYQSDESFNLTFSVPSKHFYHFGVYYSELSVNVTLPGQRVFKIQVFNGTHYLVGEKIIDLFQIANNLRYHVYMSYSARPLYVDSEGIINFSFTKQNGSIYGPIICGLELLQVSDHDMPLGTDSDEVATLKNVTSSFSSLNTWSGDPCLPYAYNWLTCTTDTRPFISTISLSNKSLAGEVPTSFKDFKSLIQLSLAYNELSGSIPDLRSLQYLEVLDLRGNNLSGPIPEYLGELSSLTTLNLDYNNFSGQIPSSLLAKASGSKIKFSVAGNPFLCDENSNEEYCKASSSSNNSAKNGGKGNGALVGGVAAVGAIAALIAIAVLVFCIVKQKKKTVVVVTNEPSNKQVKMQPQDDRSESVLPHANMLGRSNKAHEFTFQAIKTMTRNFERILGKGGFGPVYHGVLQNGKEVAVKLLAKDSRQGEQEFLNEVELLSRVHHKNLVSLVGYCNESQLVLVYEFMANGSLLEALRGKGAKLVSWRDRLHIAVDAAEGLDYLHSGCNPSIIHRDVKSSNILLNDQFEGKISDFGISKAKQYNTTMMAGGSQTFTALQGSFGYLDPVYAETNIANHSIDVYAFGIVLFELVTGKPPLIQQMTRGGESGHILQWARPQIDQGDISRLVDPTLYQDFNVSSMWKVIDVAMLCVEHDRRRRPTMSEIMLELKSALSIELHNNLYDTNSSDQQMAYTYTTDVRAR